MRIVFAGTPDFTLAALDRLFALDGCELVAVYTRPDKRKGRGRKDPGAPPVKSYAEARGIPVEQPERWDAAACARLREYKADLVVVMAYGALLPPAALSAPALACVNLHLSLLPRWRGAAPVARAILNGDARTGVSLMRMDEGLDTGPVIAQREIAVGAAETSETLLARLAELAAEMTTDFMRAPQSMLAQAQAQDEARACAAPRIQKSEARIRWSRDAREIDRQIRAFIPWPVARTGDGENDLLLWEACAAASDASGDGHAGEVLAADADGIRIRCGRGALVVRRLQIAGRGVVSAQEFLNGRRGRPLVLSE